jgi:hypothetical protein
MDILHIPARSAHKKPSRITRVWHNSRNRSVPVQQGKRMPAAHIVKVLAQLSLELRYLNIHIVPRLHDPIMTINGHDVKR